MAGDYRGFVKKWTYVFLSLLLLLLITLIIAVKSSTSDRLAFASEERRADANQAPDDANEPSVEKTKTAKEEVPRPDINTLLSVSASKNEQEWLPGISVERESATRMF